MKRIIVKFIVFLLLGAAVNVAVAWSLALTINPLTIHQPPGHHRAGARIIEEGYWYAFEKITVGATRWVTGSRGWRSASGEAGTNPEILLPDWWTEARNLAKWSKWMIADARGWPMLSMWLQLDYQNPRGRAESSSGIRMPLAEWTDPKQWGIDSEPRYLPLRIIWRGFIINTFFYAAILIVLFVIPIESRRWWRKKHNCCPTCAYPIGTSPVCTECGRAVKVPA